jgi:hypothetical protein
MLVRVRSLLARGSRVSSFRVAQRLTSHLFLLCTAPALFLEPLDPLLPHVARLPRYRGAAARHALMRRGITAAICAQQQAPSTGGQ